MESLREQAWRKSSVEFTNYLNVGKIYVALNSRSYLTESEGEELRNNVILRSTKINNLMAWMPKKGGTWFEDFVGALNETKTGTGHATIIQALQNNLYEAAKELKISQEVVHGEVSAIFGRAVSVTREVSPIQVVDQESRPSQQSQSQDDDPMYNEPFANHENWILVNLKQKYKIKEKEIQLLPTVPTTEYTTKEQLNEQVTELKNYSILIEVVNDIEFMTAICQMDGKIYQCTVRDDLTKSDSTYYSSHIIGYDHQKKKPESDESRGFSSDMTQHSFYQYLCQLINKGEWKDGLSFGRVLSGSWLVADIKAQELVLTPSRSDEIAFEMEGVGIAAACQNTNVKGWLVIKGVSDYANRDKGDVWQPAAARNATRYLSDMINKKFSPTPPVEP